MRKSVKNDCGKPLKVQNVREPAKSAIPHPPHFILASVLVHLLHVYGNLRFYIFEILIHFYPNLVVKLAKISPEMVVKNDLIFGKPSPLSSAVII